MAPPTTSGQVDDFTFVMTCIQNASDGFPKPDFEKVATQVGAKNANACYHRLWAIKRNWGMTGSKKGPVARGGGGGGGGGPQQILKSTTAVTRKRVRGGKAAADDEDTESSGDDLAALVAPVKKRKVANGTAAKKGVKGAKGAKGVKKEATAAAANDEDEGDDGEGDIRGDTEELSHASGSEDTAAESAVDEV